jgi:hypothetical protein
MEKNDIIDEALSLNLIGDIDYSYMYRNDNLDVWHSIWFLNFYEKTHLPSISMSKRGKRRVIYD